MQLTLDGDVVRADSRARERFYDSRGYGHVRGGDLDLAPVEAAHLCYRGDIDAVDGRDVGDLLTSGTVSAVDFLVYKDLRDRGFYLTPAREGWVDDPDGADFVVYPRGKGPWDDEVAYRVRVVGERDDVPAASLGDCVLAVVDEESELTYLDTSTRTIEGTSDAAVPELRGELLAERVLCWDPPDALYQTAFYGQQLDEDAVQLSLVEAAYLARAGTLTVGGGEPSDGRRASSARSSEGGEPSDGRRASSARSSEGGEPSDGRRASSARSSEGGEPSDAVVERGRDVEGERFDRRLSVYAALRDSGVVPKTGFKFGADFRTYADVESVDDLGHSELLVRVLPADHSFEPRDLALDVRLAHGVRKTMVFALVDEGIEWVQVERLTP